MRVGSGLAFDPACDASACASFDPDLPALSCIESCKNLFVPRIPAGDPALLPESGVCDGATMFECWEKLDYVGGSTPVRLETASGKSVLAYPTKDGHVYLVDANHLGTLYQRKKLVDVCGTVAEPCQLDAEAERLALRAARAVGARMAGVDLLPDRDGRTVVLEVNAVPGWRALAAATGIDVAAAILAALRDECR